MDRLLDTWKVGLGGRGCGKNGRNDKKMTRVMECLGADEVW